MTRLRHAVPFLPLLLALACGGDGVTAPDVAAQGTFHLQTAGGSALPAVIKDIPGDRITITAGSLTLRPTGTFTMALHFVEVFVGSTFNITDNFSGNYTASNGVVVLTDREGAKYEGTYVDGTVTLDINGIAALFGPPPALAVR